MSPVAGVAAQGVLSSSADPSEEFILRLRLFLMAVCLSCLSGLSWGASTEFTYQGFLRSSTVPANGTYDIECVLFDAPSSGTQVGLPVTNNAVTVTNGLFTVPLDFGIAAFRGPDRWLEVHVRATGDPGFTVLTPRQKLTATPYALALPYLRTEASMNGPSFLSANVIAGAPVNAFANGVTGVVIAGGGATNGFPQTINANYSSILGGYSNTITGSGFQSTIAGGVGNTASASTVAIGGGQSNTAGGQFGTVGGGIGNQASAPYATVAGGNTNIASAQSSFVAGGDHNTASGTTSFAAGNRAKATMAGSFVWGDSTAADVTSTRADQMTLRATGGVTLTVDATNANSVPVGTLYRDNIVAAWGRVAADGTLSDAFNVASVTRNSAGNYTVVLNTAFSGSALVPVVSVAYLSGVQPSTAATLRIAATQLTSNTTFFVFINNGNFTPADAYFTFVVTGR